MKTRIISALLWAPVLIGFIYIGGTPLLFALMAVSLIGQTEFFRAVKMYKDFGKNIMYASTIALYLSVLFWGYEYVLIIAMLTFLSIFVYFMFKFETLPFEKISMYIFSMFYLPLTFLCVYEIRNMENGNLLIWLIFILAFSSDTFAYFTGKFIGKTKLAPVLSPNKTVEGSIGGIVGSITMVFIYFYFIERYTSFNFEFTTKNLLILICLGGFGSVVSQFGDLCASAIKRQKSVKDYGNLMKGHGGILDRFDSVIFTTQFLFIMLYLVK